MLSESMEIIDFLNRVSGKDLDEVVWLANLEATDAQRLVIKGRHRNDVNVDAADSYAGQLVQMIDCLRYGAHPAGLDRQTCNACDSLRISRFSRPQRLAD
jgi:phage gp46-like protein